MGGWQKNINRLRGQIAVNSLDVTDTVEDMVLDLVQAEGESVANALWLVAMVAKAAEHKNEGLIRKLAEVGPEHWGPMWGPPEPAAKAPMYRGYAKEGIVRRPEGNALVPHEGSASSFLWGRGSIEGARALAQALIVDALMQGSEGLMLGAQERAVALREVLAASFVQLLDHGDWEISREHLLLIIRVLNQDALRGGHPPGNYDAKVLATFTCSRTLHTITEVTTEGPTKGRLLWHQRTFGDGPRGRD